MLKARLLLQNKLNTLPEHKKKQFLLECIEKHKLPWASPLELGEISTKDIHVDKDIFCKICNKYNFIRDRYSETCQDCGYTQELTPTEKPYEKIEYIKPGSNLVKITKDSKKITVDLNKINLWLQDTDPLAGDIKKIIENLDIIYQNKSIELPNNVQTTSIALLYNFNSMYENYTGSLKKSYNKKAILALCIFYGSSINNYTVSLQQLSILFNVNVTDIIVTNSLFKDLFKETEYFKYLTLKEQTDCNIQLSIKNKLLFQKIKNDLLNNFPTIKEPLENVENVAIIYFITNKINTVLKYTLKYLEERCNVSTTSISNKSKSIEKFYKNNPKLYKQLII